MTEVAHKIFQEAAVQRLAPETLKELESICREYDFKFEDLKSRFDTALDAIGEIYKRSEDPEMKDSYLSKLIGAKLHRMKYVDFTDSGVKFPEEIKIKSKDKRKVNKLKGEIEELAKIIAYPGFGSECIGKLRGNSVETAQGIVPIELDVLNSVVEYDSWRTFVPEGQMIIGGKTRGQNISGSKQSTTLYVKSDKFQNLKIIQTYGAVPIEAGSRIRAYCDLGMDIESEILADSNISDLLKKIRSGKKEIGMADFQKFDFRMMDSDRKPIPGYQDKNSAFYGRIILGEPRESEVTNKVEKLVDGRVAITYQRKEK